jgi:hypothetical protein
MTNTTEVTKDQTTKASKAAKTKAAKAPEPKSDQVPTMKAKEPKPVKSKVTRETADRLPASIEELKATKGGLVCHLFLSGKDKDDIAKELKAAFKLSDAQASKIIRRITGRLRFYKRVFELMAAK